jgi:hypothetical protein
MFCSKRRRIPIVVGVILLVLYLLSPGTISGGNEQVVELVYSNSLDSDVTVVTTDHINGGPKKSIVLRSGTDGITDRVNIACQDRDASLVIDFIQQRPTQVVCRLRILCDANVSRISSTTEPFHADERYSICTTHLSTLSGEGFSRIVSDEQIIDRERP